MNTELDSPLGKSISYVGNYQRDLLFVIPRKLQRDKIQMPDKVPFKGVDIWNAWELSWLNAKGKPIVALGEFIFPCESPNLIESKSFKLYLNSFNNTRFNSTDEATKVIQRDLSAAAGADVKIKIIPVEKFLQPIVRPFAGVRLDHLDIPCDTYHVAPEFLKTEEKNVTETVYSDLLKSNCPVTGQPDWASIQVSYTGKKISHEGLLKYIVSFRNHDEFHEQCVERIFMDILQHCQPNVLCVHACYTRRGGLDINPFRSTEADFPVEMTRQVRQ